MPGSVPGGVFRPSEDVPQFSQSLPPLSAPRPDRCLPGRGIRLTAVSVQVLVLVSQGYAQRYPVAAPACSRI